MRNKKKDIYYLTGISYYFFLKSIINNMVLIYIVKARRSFIVYTEKAKEERQKKYISLC